jgi:hypothetical protein
MALPWIIGGLALGAGKLIYDAVTDESSSSSSSYSDREEREKEAKQRAKEEKNEKIREEISRYKENQLSQIEEKYEAIVSFDWQEDLKILLASIKGRMEYEDIDKASKVQIIYQDKTRQHEIDNLKKETIELKEAVKELEAIKNEIFK